MSTIKVNTITKRTGSTLTLGEAGTTVAIASGATTSGMGRTGTVDWDTTIKTSSFTAVNGSGYFINTTGGVVTMTLPASPSVGSIVSFKDYARQFGNNSLTIGRNSSNLDGTATDVTIGTTGQTGTLIYMDATKGWSLINDDTTQSLGQQFVTATGGTVATVCTNFKIHTFTSPGTFTVCSAGNSAGSNSVEYIVVAGGGGGGANRGGGGGAGGFRYSAPTLSPLTYPAKPLTGSAIPVSAQGYPITIGAGGTAGNPPTTNAGQGANSVGLGITSAGGGRGDRANTGLAGANGGSGGGGADNNGNPIGGGSGNTPPVSPSQGNNGGAANGPIGGGGGGGALAAGADGINPNAGGPGGVGGGFPGAFGTSGQNCGSFYYFAGGGGGGGRDNASGAPGDGGLGGGGRGGTGLSPVPGSQTKDGVAATANTGGGGGGGGNNGGPCKGAAGGSGIVIIRYKFQ